MDAGPTAIKTDPTGEPQGHSFPLIERAPLPMIEVEGREHTICSVNTAFCSLLGKKRDELIGKPFAKIVRNGDRCVPLLDRVYETGEFETHAEQDVAGADPAYWLYAMWPMLDANRQPARVVIQLTKAAQSHQDIAAMNEALLIGALRQHELREEAETANAQMQLEIIVRKRAEEELQHAQTKLRANADQLEQTVAERTTQLRASVEELEAFSYSLVHDLRAPVRAIHGFTQLALETSAESGGTPPIELLNRVIKAAIRMDSLILDVLSLTQVIRRSIKTESINVEKLVHTLVEERPELSPTFADVEIKSPLLCMLGHEASLSQCLTNLLSNAVKFVKPGQKARVTIWSEELPASTSHSVPAAESMSTSPFISGSPLVRLWIEDEGIGMDADTHETIFHIFQRLHSNAEYEGSGIGLAIVRKAVERMGGRVGVESKSGQGSRFWLELPKG